MAEVVSLEKDFHGLSLTNSIPSQKQGQDSSNTG